jgi:hypothetical protein
MIAPGDFPILEVAPGRRWWLLYGELVFEGVGEPLPVPPGYICVDSGCGPALITKELYEQARGAQGEGWAYQ